MDELKVHLGDLTLIAGQIPNNRIPIVRMIEVWSKKSSTYLFSFSIDERYFNTIEIIGYNTSQSKFAIDIKSRFNEFKKSNINYGNWDNTEENKMRYQGSIPLYVEDFFEYLKIDNRDKLISNILENE
jgi:hypothetical protein